MRETTYVPLYPLECTEKYGSNTVRFIDDILTVEPGLPSRKGPTLNTSFKRGGAEGGVYGGMYPKHILDDKGEQVANSVYYHRRTKSANSAFSGYI